MCHDTIWYDMICNHKFPNQLWQPHTSIFSHLPPLLPPKKLQKRPNFHPRGQLAKKGVILLAIFPRPPAHLLIIQSCKDFRPNLGLHLSQNTSSLQGFHQRLWRRGRRGVWCGDVVLSQINRRHRVFFSKKKKGGGSFSISSRPKNTI